MTNPEFRIESNQPIGGLLWPVKGLQHYEVADRALAVSIAAKSFSCGTSDIRVVHVPTGEVLFTKPAASRAEWSGDA